VQLLSKARTLAALKGQLQHARVLPQAAFSTTRWQQEPAACLALVRARLGDVELIVRSSAASEDSACTSMAGRFLSVPHVKTDAELSTAIDQVIASYAPGDPARDEVLVQPHAATVLRSGVAFNTDPNTGAPYRVINYSEGADTSVVTGGKGGATHVHVPGAPLVGSPELAPILALVDELESLFNGVPLDIEFAVCDDELSSGSTSLVLLQARPLILKLEREPLEALQGRLHQIEQKLIQGMRPHPFLHGRATVYGVMPDWNRPKSSGCAPGLWPCPSTGN